VVLVFASAVLLAFYIDATNFLSLTYEPALFLALLVYTPVFWVAARLSRIPLLREQTRSKQN